MASLPAASTRAQASDDFAALTATLPSAHAVIVERNGQRIFADQPTAPDGAELRWRWASETKQWVAVLVMQQVAVGKLELDAPLARYLPRFGSPNAARITLRQLLRHQSGLPNPEDVVPSPDSPSGFYSRANRQDPLAYCAGPPKGEPGQGWTYNNCDYIVLGAVLKAVTGQTWDHLLAKRIARPLGLASVGTKGGDHLPVGKLLVAGQSEEQAMPDLAIARFGASASLSGTPSDLLGFDRALLAGRLMPEVARAEMWDGQAKLGFMALGQWVFSARLKGCAAPVRIVERRGGIGGLQMRNFILPDLGVIAVAFVGNDTFDFGEVWQASGFSYNLLSKAACA